MAESIIEVLRDIGDQFLKLNDMWQGDNVEGVDLNDLNEFDEVADLYPFGKSLDEFTNDYINWVEEVEDKVGGNTFTITDSLKESKKLNETWAGEEVINSLVERAKGWVDDGDEVDDAVAHALDDGLIYSEDILNLAKHYGVLDDSELINLFYEELYGDVYNEISDYYDEVHEEVEEELTDSLKRYNIRETLDYVAVDEDIAELQKIFDEEGIDGLNDIFWEDIETNFPSFAEIFDSFYTALESDDSGRKLDSNAVSIKDYWDYIDEPLFRAVVEYAKTRKEKKPIECLMLFDTSL